MKPADMMMQSCDCSHQTNNMITTYQAYGPLGAPSKQPRQLSYQPKSNRLGLGDISSDSSNEVTLTNKDLLELNQIPTSEKLENVKSGQVIMVAKPFVYCVSTAFRSKRCDHCLQMLDPQKKISCSCKYAYYCSSNCLEDDKSIHGQECFYIKKKGSPPTSDTARFILRILIKMRNNGSNLADIVPNKVKPRKFCDLLDHYDDILQSPRLEMVDLYYSQVVGFMGESDAPQPDYFLECYGRMAVNSFNILDNKQDGIGMALYLGPSIMDHSCNPNAAVSFDGINIVVKSLIDRNQLDFNDVYISYISLLDYTKHRQDYLLRHYYFLCRCPRCLDHELERSMFAIQCSNCDTGSLFMGDDAEAISPEPCTECHVSIGDHSWDRYKETAAFVDEVTNRVQASLELSLLCLKLMRESRFGPFHILMLKASEITFENLLEEISSLNDKQEYSDDLMESALFHGLNLLSGFRRYSSHVWSQEGFCLLKVAELEFVLGNNEDCERHLRRAKEILHISLNENGAKTLLSRADQLLNFLLS